EVGIDRTGAIVKNRLGATRRGEDVFVRAGVVGEDIVATEAVHPAAGAVGLEPFRRTGPIDHGEGVWFWSEGDIGLIIDEPMAAQHARIARLLQDVGI